jgi:CheY-like chemotaxis protein
VIKSVLIIEDYPRTIQLLQYVLEKKQIVTEAAMTGEAALHLLGKKKYDLIFLDVMLPRVDGFEVCRRIKANEGMKNTPVIFVTAYDVTDIKDKCLAAGGDGMLLKPFSQSDVDALLKRYDSPATA